MFIHRILIVNKHLHLFYFFLFVKGTSDLGFSTPHCPFGYMDVDMHQNIVGMNFITNLLSIYL